MRPYYNALTESFIDPATGGDIHYKLNYKLEPCDPLASGARGYSVEFRGEIIESKEDETETKIGEIRGTVVLVGAAINAGEDVADICDEISCEALMCYEALFEEDAEFREDLDLAGFGDNLLILDWLTILPRYRGNGVGLLAIRDAIRRFGGGCRVAALVPTPLQHREGAIEEDEKLGRKRRMGYASMEKNENRAMQKLRKHYARAGFKLVPRAYAVMYLDLGRIAPTLECMLTGAKPRRAPKSKAKRPAQKALKAQEAHV